MTSMKALLSYPIGNTHIYLLLDIIMAGQWSWVLDNMIKQQRPEPTDFLCSMRSGSPLSSYESREN